MGLTNRLIKATLLAATAAAALNLTGCAAYFNYPELDGSAAWSDANVRPIPGLMAAATAQVLREDFEAAGTEQPWIFNPPKGTTPEAARRTLNDIESRSSISGGMLVGDPGTLDRFGAVRDDLLSYSITKVWVRGRNAVVDVVRGAGDDYRRATLRFEGGATPWVITNLRNWRLGETPPQLFGWPEPASEQAAAELIQDTQDEQHEQDEQPAETPAQESDEEATP